ncbi:uncharacterized protein LOC126840790 [Adelges cooleyi]|uniref:uncharacterized protein LOC126840790 n=1 Tax=Adelges cooleyi TaxID=133065 RepID=UPI00217F5F43|nr:uncharacterized protein LOC126840790 [Adelges cooleyi]
MYSKLFLKFLLALSVCIPHRFILANNDAVVELEELIQNTGWKSIENVKILDDGKEITMLNLLNASNSEITSESSNGQLTRHLAIMLSCEQSKFVREYIISVLSIIKICGTQAFGKKLSICFNSLLGSIEKIDFMITQMLNVLTYFYQLSPTNTDIKHFYHALMALKLYSEYETNTFTESSFFDDESKPNANNIAMKYQEIEQLLYSSDLQIQRFTAMYCLPTIEPIRLNDIPIYTKILFSNESSHTNENFSKATSNIVNKFNEEHFVALGFAHLELYKINNKNIDLEHIYELLDQQQQDGHKIRLRWLDEPTEVTTIIQEVKSQYSTKKFAAFQKLSLKSFAQMFYKLLLVTVQAIFNETKIKIYEGHCPPNFFSMLRYNWVELKSNDFPAIREACLSIRNSISKGDCQETFYNSLKRRWMNFKAIKLPAIAAACFTVTVWSTIPNVPEYNKWISILIESIYSFLYRPSKAIANRLASTKKEFWGLFKNELKRFLSVDWPAEIAETLETLTFYFENEHNNVKPEDVIGLLELEMKTASADFADNEETLREIDSDKRLEILREFTDNIVKLKKSINNININNVLLFNASNFDETKLVRPSKVFDDVALQKVCKLSTSLIEFFTLLKNDLGFYNQQEKRFSNFIFNRMCFVTDNLQERLLSIVHFLLLEMLKAPKTENVNLRNAIVLMFMFDTKLINPMNDDVNDGSWIVEQLKQLTLLIINQINYYVVNNCDILEYKSRISGLQNAHRQIIYDIDNLVLEMRDIPLIDDECKITISLGSFDALVDGKKDDLNPLKCIAELKFQWDGALQLIQTIRKEVLSSINPKKFAEYQVLVQNSVTSIFLGYILNILQAAGQNEVKFTNLQIASILEKFEQFESMVYPNLKVDSPEYNFNIFVWCFKQNQISGIKATILKYKIERKIEFYGINISHYYSVLKSNNIISDVHASGDVNKNLIAPLKVFVEQWVAKFENDFYCVENYMKLII